MLKPRKFDIADSNIANLGSDLEKKVKHAASEHEDAWKGVGQEIGIKIWRIEKFHVVAWPEKQYGKFYSGDSYIVLRTYKKTPDSEKFSFDVHFWIGKDSTQDEYGTAAYKTVELDDYLHGDPVQHREIQNYESELFLSYFKKVEFLEGGVDSGFHHVEAKEYKPRLFHLKGKKNVVVRQVEFSVKSLNSGDCFVLDEGHNIYQMNGRESGAMEKLKAAELTRAIDDERGGKPNVWVFEQDDKNDANANKFWELLGGRTEIAPATPDVPVAEEKKLFRLSDETGKMEMKQVKEVSRKSLDSSDVFILDAGFEIFAWIGKGASKDEKAKALSYATDYLFKHNRPKTLPISRILEGAENDVFNTAIGK
jgi:gelsolin